MVSSKTYTRPRTCSTRSIATRGCSVPNVALSSHLNLDLTLFLPLREPCYAPLMAGELGGLEKLLELTEQIDALGGTGEVLEAVEALQAVKNLDL